MQCQDRRCCKTDSSKYGDRCPSTDAVTMLFPATRSVAHIPIVSVDLSGRMRIIIYLISRVRGTKHRCRHDRAFVKNRRTAWGFREQRQHHVSDTCMHFMVEKPKCVQRSIHTINRISRPLQNPYGHSQLISGGWDKQHPVHKSASSLDAELCTGCCLRKM